MVDTLRRDHVSLYGYSHNTTPHIDAFFADGTTFENATSPAPCTVPAVKQVLTGARDFDDRRPRLAEILKDNGYATAAVVSQHHFRTLAGARPEYRRGFEHFDIQRANQVDQHNMTSRDATEVSDLAIAWLDSHATAQPFFLWLHYFDPHDPYEPPASYRTFPAPDPNFSGDRRTYLLRAFKQALEKADDRGKRAIMSRPNPYAQFGVIFSPEQVATLRSYYDAEILYADAQINRVLRRLEAMGPTLVVFTSDHGERLGEENRWAHCQSVHSYEIDVPLMLSWRGPNGHARIDHAVSTLDIVPTVLSAAGVRFEASHFDGQNLFESSDDRMIFTGWSREFAIQDANWKLIVPTSGEPATLFDIRHDPYQSRNLAQQESERSAKMFQALNNAINEHKQMESRISEILDDLRAIGYIR